jgi:hypothetical protein
MPRGETDAAVDASTLDGGSLDGAALDGSTPDGATLDAAMRDATVDAGAAALDPCGAWVGDAAWVCQADGVTMHRTVAGATESMVCASGCASMPYGFDDVCRARAGSLPTTVNGNTLTTTQAAWVHYVALCVVPRLEGVRDDRLTAAARVAWWSLKEGLLDLRRDPNAVGFSLCHQPTGDARIGPLEVCGAGAAWQVGASAIQVPCCTLTEVQSTAARLFPELTEDALLSRTAAEAGYAGTATETGIVGSTGSLRASWLLRASPVGFTFQAPIVTNECVTGSRSWCYGTGWSTSASYAPDRASALGAIDDVRAILDALAP